MCSSKNFLDVREINFSGELVGVNVLLVLYSTSILYRVFKCKTQNVLKNGNNFLNCLQLCYNFNLRCITKNADVTMQEAVARKQNSKHGSKFSFHTELN